MWREPEHLDDRRCRSSRRSRRGSWPRGRRRRSRRRRRARSSCPGANVQVRSRIVTCRRRSLDRRGPVAVSDVRPRPVRRSVHDDRIVRSDGGRRRRDRRRGCDGAGSWYSFVQAHCHLPERRDRDTGATSTAQPQAAARYMPSVSLTCGSSRWPQRARRSHGPCPAGRATSSAGCAVTRCSRDAGPLDVGERAHRVHEQCRPASSSSTAASTRARWTAARRSGAAASIRHRASGRRRRVPRPEHGASTSTRSNEPRRNGGSGGVGGHHRRGRRALARMRPTRPFRMSAGDHRRPGGREHHRLAARCRAQVGDPLPGLRPDRLGDPLAGEVLHVAVRALGDRAVARSSRSSTATCVLRRGRARAGRRSSPGS